jgi:hypothetical protein
LRQVWDFVVGNKDVEVGIFRGVQHDSGGKELPPAVALAQFLSFMSFSSVCVVKHWYIRANNAPRTLVVLT